MISRIQLVYQVVVCPLPPPINVKVDSFNMGAILRWEVAPSLQDKLAFTAKYRMSVRNGTEQLMCKGIEERQCDFGKLPSHHAQYIFSVRTEQSGETSKWATCKFFIDRQTVIGPPSVSLVSVGGAIEVNIQDPVLKISSLREVYTKVGYSIRHWSEEHPEDAQTIKAVSLTHLLRPLVPNTKYCVQVQVFIPAYNFRGQMSNATCEMSSIKREEHKWSGKLVGGLVVLAVVLPFLMLVLWSIYKGRRFLNPKEHLPDHFKQHLFESSSVKLNTPPLEKFDLICALGEEPRYPDVTYSSGSDERLAISYAGISGDISKYYNGVVQMPAYEVPYQNTTVGI